MSWFPAPNPINRRTCCNALETIIVPRTRDLGSFSVRRALPSVERQMVGPFIFFDQMGPDKFQVGAGMDVRPHPHIGLSTVTYLFEGELIHRDSLGTVLPIRPGEVNWMTAARGIAHSERTSSKLRSARSKMFGIQAWVALQAVDEDNLPGFFHYPAARIPIVAGEGKQVRIVAGTMFGVTSPVETSSPMYYADVTLDGGASIPLDPEHDERAIYTVAGHIEIAGDIFQPGNLLVLKPGDKISVRGKTDARFMLLGGEPMEGPRYIWWNFVSSRKDRIEQAKEDWRMGRFERVVGDPELMRLPDSGGSPVDYP